MLSAGSDFAGWNDGSLAIALQSGADEVSHDHRHCLLGYQVTATATATQATMLVHCNGIMHFDNLSKV
jgi:hypothetical protein